ncbi:MAG: exodeoxyribonuclease VII small subunit [Planctomycetota bacterium]
MSAPPELPDPSELSYEQAVEALEVLIDQIESGEIGLEASLAAYERGMALKKRCESILDQAEHRLRELTEGGETRDLSGSDAGA